MEEEFIEKFSCVIESIRIGYPIKNQAQFTAWKDWATDKLMEELSLNEEQAGVLVEAVISKVNKNNK